MWFRSNTKHKTKPKLLTLLASLMLVLSMSIPMTTYAYEDNAGGTQGENANLDNTSAGQGVSYDRTGYLVYIAGVDGQLKSPVAFISGSAKLPDSTYDKSYLYSRIGHQEPDSDKIFKSAPWGTVVNNQYGSARDALVNYVQQKGDLIIKNLLGQDVYNMTDIAPDQYYLMVETVSWHGRPGDGAINTVASHWGYVQMYADGKAYAAGKAYYPYNKIAQALHVEKEWPGLVENGIIPPTTFLGTSSYECLPLNVMQSAGYGIAAFRLDMLTTSDHQTTCDETKNGTPSKPPEESTGTFKIVKSYRVVNTDTGIPTDKGTFNKPDSSPNITIEDESEYKLVAWRTSTTFDPNILSTEWEQQVPAIMRRSGTQPGEITLEAPETTLYLLLEKYESDPPVGLTGNSDFILSQSTITRKIKLSYPDGAGITIMKDVGFKWVRPAHKYTCGGHNCDYVEHHPSYSTDAAGNVVDNSYDTNETHIVYCTWGEWKDNSVSFSLKNTTKTSYPDILATKGGWEAVTSTGLSAYTKYYQPGESSIYKTGSIFTRNNFDYSCVLLRGKDKLTVASWKNTDLGTALANSDLANVSTSGFAIANKASSSRKTSTYYDSFVATFADDSADLSTTYGPTASVSHHNNNDMICNNDTQIYVLTPNPFLTITAGVRVETYSGTLSAGSLDTSCNSVPTSYGAFSGMTELSNKNMVRGIEVQSGAILSFVPYIQMNYDVQTATHEAYGSSTTNHRTAYVIGNIQRVMSPNDYAEVSWKSVDPSSPNLTLDSLQWSTHSSAVDFISNKLGADKLSKFTVLPGGATLSLTIKESDRQKVQATTYQCVIDGAGKIQIDNAGGSYDGLTIADAEASHRAYVDSVINGLEKLNVEQWVTNDLSSISGSTIEKESTNVWNISGSSMVEWGVNLKSAGHSSQTASLDTKYYFAADGGRPEAPASEGDLDVQELSTVTKKYTFFTNTYGEIRYTVDDVNPNTESNERKGNLANDAIANAINQRTHVVDKLRAAVEQGTGNDPSGRSKTGTAWYNEAFDGITVYVQTTTLSVGYIDPAQRSVVLDVKLTQTQDNQSDMFNKDKYNMSQYRTKSYSDAYMMDDMVGEFKNTAVYMKDMNQLFISKKFFIPNATVDDLH